MDEAPSKGNPLKRKSDALGDSAKDNSMSKKPKTDQSSTHAALSRPELHKPPVSISVSNL